MSKSIRFLSRLACVATILVVAGCSETSKLFERDTIQVACPPMGALKEAEELTRFRLGDGRDLTDVAFEAKIGRVVGKCEVKQSESLAKIQAGFEFFGERGPALDKAETPLKYFVAVKAPNGKIARREAYDVSLVFDGGAQEARAVDYLFLEIPDATPAALRAYQIYVGLQMTREEFAFSQRGQRRR